jgi:hypothetical protein
MKPSVQYQAAQDELELYFAAAPGIWGLRGAPFDGGGGVTVWDERRSAVEHAKRLDYGTREQHEKLRRVTATVERFRREIYGAWDVAMRVLTPRRWPSALTGYPGHMARGERGGDLTGLLLTSNRLRAAAGQDATPLQLLEYVERLATASNRDLAGRLRFLEKLREECENVYACSLRAYEVLRLKRARAANDVTEWRRAMG